MSNVQGQIDRINGEVSSQKSLIAQIQTALEGKAAGVKLPTLTNEGAATDLLAGKQLIDGDGNVVMGTMAEVTQATPSISVSSGGLITASATQTAGKVSAGTKSATKQLTTQAAQTITPGTADQTIASGRYLTGTQTIKGDANLVASNIKSGVSIFGVAGSYEGSGGSGGAVETCTVSLSLSTTSSTGIAAFSSAQYLGIDDIPTVSILTPSTSTKPISATHTVRKNSMYVVVLPSTVINNISGTAISVSGGCQPATAGTNGLALFNNAVPFCVTDDCSISMKW